MFMEEKQLTEHENFIFLMCTQSKGKLTKNPKKQTKTKHKEKGLAKILKQQCKST